MFQNWNAILTFSCKDKILFYASQLEFSVSLYALTRNYAFKSHKIIFEMSDNFIQINVVERNNT